MSGPVLPGGVQVELRRGPMRATVIEVGACLRALSCDGEPVLDGYPPEVMVRGGHGQVLIPWPNRIDGGEYEFGGGSHQLPLTEPPKGNAIHGLVRFANWTVAEQDDDRVVMEHRLHAQPGYPFVLDLAVEYSLGDDGITVRTTAANVGAGALPYGAGYHPYITAGTSTIDACRLRVPAATLLETDDRGIPTGRRMPVEETEHDYRTPRVLGEGRLDTCFGDLLRDDDGLARVVLEGPDGGRTVTLWMDGGHPYLMIFTGDTLEDSARRRRGLGVEPMTCPPNAFRSGDSLRVLEPGATAQTAWGITVS